MNSFTTPGEATVKSKKSKEKIFVGRMTIISYRAQCERQRTLTVSHKLICGNHPSDKAEFLQADDLISTIQ